MEKKPNKNVMKASGSDRERANLLEQPIQVVNIGLRSFADDLVSHGVQVVHVDWVPPARGNRRLANLLSKLMD